MDKKSIFIRSVFFGVICLVAFLAKDWILYSEFQWKGTLFGVILGTLIFYGFLWINKREDEKK